MLPATPLATVTCARLTRCRRTLNQVTFLSAFGFEEVSFDEVSFEEASFELFVSSEALFEGLEDADSVDSDLESDFSGPRLSVL